MKTTYPGCLLVVFLLLASPAIAQDLKKYFGSLDFKFTQTKGIGHEKGCTRRDPSDVIKVGDTYYVYYTKIYGRSPGYWGTVWYATSQDEGFTWTERGEALGVGATGKFDSQATFTPNILFANGNYYLYYTGVKPTPGNQKGEFENNSTTDITGIGVAVASSPDGPFRRVSSEPIVKISPEPDKFDSYRVDDAVLFYRNGLYWMYHKGRARTHGEGGPTHTQMGVAFSKYPEGPFTKLDDPILPNSHEVMLWQQGTGIGALASLSSTFEYAPDGIDFTTNRLSVKATNRPIAMGVYRPDLTDRSVSAAGIDWGISMVMNGDECYLTRFHVTTR